MEKITKAPQRIFLKSVLSFVGLIILGFFSYFRAGLNKADLQKITGNINYLEKTFNNYPPARNSGKCRYIRVDNYLDVFEIFIGKDKGDFAPVLEKIDSLRIGDEITVYVDNLISPQEDIINSNVRFIDRGNEPVFIRGNSLKNVAIFLVGLSALSLIGLVVLKKKGKIA
ncbi:hypothetical protein [Chitinophaga varians]|uniref:hypothetical protein n=1 Tax=Chitinophaga varians TaxID=2202339 RepID=UPI00165FAFF4|nr:hypothetical protein [Chitinophaga varians]MBC9911686.1 hypothetical protein [Chitinophaga varians]